MKTKLVLVCLVVLALGSVLTGQHFMENAGVKKIVNAPQEDYTVSIEFVIDQRQVNQYPVVTDAFMRAVETWAGAVPIRATVYIENPVGFIWHIETHWRDRPGVIEVLLDDLQSPPYSAEEELIGLWKPEVDRLLLDADRLEKDPALAYAVALHELGHAFGVPHIVGEDKSALTGYIVVPIPDDKAQEYVMYPFKSNDKKQDTLSPVEIDIARWHIMHVLTDPTNKSVGCSLTRTP